MEFEIYPYNIEIDGARADTDQVWRLSRLYMMLGYAQALADIDNNEEYFKKIKNLYDDKGILTVTWLVPPSGKEKEYLQKAWGSAVTDYEGNAIEHVF